MVVWTMTWALYLNYTPPFLSILWEFSPKLKSCIPSSHRQCGSWFTFPYLSVRVASYSRIYAWQLFSQLFMLYFWLQCITSQNHASGKSKLCNKLFSILSTVHLFITDRFCVILYLQYFQNNIPNQIPTKDLDGTDVYLFCITQANPEVLWS